MEEESNRFREWRENFAEKTIEYFPDDRNQQGSTVSDSKMIAFIWFTLNLFVCTLIINRNKIMLIKSVNHFMLLI